MYSFGFLRDCAKAELGTSVSFRRNQMVMTSSFASKITASPLKVTS